MARSFEDIEFDFRRSNGFVAADLDQLGQTNYNIVSSDITRDLKEVLKYVNEMLAYDYTQTVYGFQKRMFDTLAEDVKNLERDLAPFREINEKGQITWKNPDRKASLQLSIRSSKNNMLNLFLEKYPDLRNQTQMDAVVEQTPSTSLNVKVEEFPPKDPTEPDSIQTPPVAQNPTFDALQQLQQPVQKKSNAGLFILGGLALAFGGWYMAKKKRK